MIESVSLLGVAPVIDYLVNGGFEGASGPTIAIVSVVQDAGIDPTFGNILVCLVLLYVAKNAVAFGSALALAVLHFRMIKRLVLGLLTDITNARWPFFVSHSDAVLGNTMIREAEKVSVAFESLVGMIACALKLLFFVCVAFYIQWQLSAIVLAMIMYLIL